MTAFDPDLNEMIVRPAATVAGSVNLLAAAKRAPRFFRLVKPVYPWEISSFAEVSFDDAACAAAEGRAPGEIA